LAYLSDGELKEVLNQLLTDPEAVKHIGERGERLLGILAQVRRDGYSLSDEEFIPGIRAIGAPIFRADGKVEAAINMPVFAGTVGLKELSERHAPMLVSTADDISVSRGFTRGLHKGPTF
jgi:DNA-binding IclR family transcriptional regulator